MPSEKKTDFAKLNDWKGNEYPKREDFCEDNIKIDSLLKSLSDKINSVLTKEQTDLLYAALSHRHDVSDINDLTSTITATKVNNSANAELFNGKSITDFVLNYSFFKGAIPRELFDNPTHPQLYMGGINFGTQVGLPVNHLKIIYIPHDHNGYGTQIAVPYENGEWKGMYIRHAVGTSWGSWNLSHSVDARFNQITDANTAKHSAVLYYPMWNQCANLPRGTQDDGVLIPYFYEPNFGFQLYFTWNHRELWWRACHSGVWQTWVCFSKQDCLRYDDAGIHTVNNKAIFARHFDAEGYDGSMFLNFRNKGAVHVTNPYNTNEQLSIGHRLMDLTNMMGGVQFRNNGGTLEVYLNGEWKSVGGKQYTVLREIPITTMNFQQVMGPSQPYTAGWKDIYVYNGGSGVLKNLYLDQISNCTALVESVLCVFIDGVRNNILHINSSSEWTSSIIKSKTKITKKQDIAMSFWYAMNYNPNYITMTDSPFNSDYNILDIDLEFKNSIVIKTYNLHGNITGLVKTEK